MQPSALSQEQARLVKQARACARWLQRRSKAPLPGTRFSRGVAALLLALAIWLRRLFRDHWDIGVFDVAFGSVKAFGIYPALFRLGLAWTIPMLEYAPLNTQLWTAGYLALRGRVVSKMGERRHGVALEILDGRRAAAFGVAGRGFLHVFSHDGHTLEIRVRAGRLGAWWRRIRGTAQEPGSIELSQLRRCVSPRLVFEARVLRGHDPLYERALMECALRDSVGAEALVAHARPAQLTASTPFGGLIKASHVATRACLRWLAERHALRVRGQHSALSRQGLALRWLGGSYQRRALRLISQVEELEYALLADLQRGVAWGHSPNVAALRSAHQRFERWSQAFEAFVTRSRRAAGGPSSGRLVAREVDGARRLGLSARLAGAVAPPTTSRILALA